jgi:hypothetical protein
MDPIISNTLLYSCLYIYSHKFGCYSWLPGEQAALRKNSVRRGYNSSDSPMCTRLSGVAVAPTPTVDHAISGQHVYFTNGHKTDRCATGLSGVPQGSWLQRSTSPDKEGNRTLFTVWWCTGLSGVPTNKRQLWPSKWSSNGS